MARMDWHSKKDVEVCELCTHGQREHAALVCTNELSEFAWCQVDPHGGCQRFEATPRDLANHRSGGEVP